MSQPIGLQNACSQSVLPPAPPQPAAREQIAGPCCSQGKSTTSHSHRSPHLQQKLPTSPLGLCEGNPNHLQIAPVGFACSKQGLQTACGNKELATGSGLRGAWASFSLPFGAQLYHFAGSSQVPPDSLISVPKQAPQCRQRGQRPMGRGSAHRWVACPDKSLLSIHGEGTEAGQAQELCTKKEAGCERPARPPLQPACPFPRAWGPAAAIFSS